MECYFDEDKIREFVQQLLSGDEDLINKAVDALGVSDPEVKVPMLLEILPTSSDDVKERICYLLDWCDQEACVPPLLNLLDEDNDYVVLAAIKTLANFARPGIVKPLGRKLHSENPQIVEQAILCLGTMIACGVIKASEPLINFILKHDSDLKALAIQNLKYLEAEQLLPAMARLRALRGPDLEGEVTLVLEEAEMRKADDVEEKLTKLFQGLYSQSYTFQKSCETELIAYGKVAVDFIIKSLCADPDDTLRFVHAMGIINKMCWKALPTIRQLIESLDRFGDRYALRVINLATCSKPALYPELAPSLIALLERIIRHEPACDNQQQRQLDSFKTSIHLALAECGRTDTFPDLVKMFESGKYEHNEWLLKALGLIASPEFLRPLFDVHANPQYSFGVKQEAERAIRAIEKRHGMQRLSLLTIFGRQEANN